ncbi:Gfo/Idh/MocA family oxidoreductase [Paracoccus sp. Z118]|uniref:Gfo/Idh/MocA family protein n=1 Tax=Paracoccus sp. Z118 TaxID=2851017 RepID=UPI001C2BE064|nr:Gfo/Idh/MocA family oxidoreductase [Paracoccus sp. Z118]MBV0893101.1 Gfo/Idh/MocA family oxidoreductase [Paracoccus sp. Z118]
MGKIGVGIIGIQPDRSWGAIAHIPALRELPDSYDIVAVSTRSEESARAAAEHYGVPQHFSSAEALCACEDVDLVAVTVKVPAHRALVSAALAAGKHVYCEWPLGNGLDEAIDMARRAKEAGVVAACGMQARFAPEIAYVRDLVADGYVGEVLSSAVVGTGGVWGSAVPPADAYTADIRNGATMLTIPVGHTLDGIVSALGEVVAVSATLANRRHEQMVIGEDRMVPLTAPDQVLVHATLENGAPLAIHYRGGTTPGTGFLWEINGTAGTLQLRAQTGHAQLVGLTLSGATGEEDVLQKLEVPEHYHAGRILPNLVGNIYRMYRSLAGDIATGSRNSPTFDDAVTRHRVLAAIETSAADGARTVQVDR